MMPESSFILAAIDHKTTGTLLGITSFQKVCFEIIPNLLKNWLNYKKQTEHKHLYRSFRRPIREKWIGDNHQHRTLFCHSGMKSRNG